MSPSSDDFFQPYINWAQRPATPDAVSYVEVFIWDGGDVGASAIQYHGSLKYRPPYSTTLKFIDIPFPGMFYGFAEWLHDVDFANGAATLDRVRVEVRLLDRIVVNLRFHMQDGTNKGVDLSEPEYGTFKWGAESVGRLHSTGTDGTGYTIVLRQNSFDPTPFGP